MSSQSPSEVPADQAAVMQAGQYVTSWQAITELLRRGHNWSGHEANVCLLNTQSGRFVDVSAVSGIDFLDDARGVAVVDWDRDGNLDLWITNRTSPRVRFLQNQAASDNQFVALKLRGVTCNHDAIGARVELHRGPGQEAPLIQTVRAGDGYLAQSSKTVHFGLGSDPQIEKAVVRWPGGAAEEFTGVAAGGCFELVQGEGVARRVNRRSPPGGLAVSPFPQGLESGSSTRVIAARRLPLPSLEGVSLAGEPLHLNDALAEPRLILLWAPWCEPCLTEIHELAANKARLRAAGLEIVVINVDGAKPESADATAESAAVLKQLGFEGTAGLATAELLDLLDVSQRVLTNKPFPPPIPSSFLLDGTGRLVCVYKGPVGVEALLRDVEALAVATADPRDAAVPFPGRWYTNPFPPDLLAIPKRLIQIGKLQSAAAYLERIESRGARDYDEFVRLFARDLAATYVQLAKLLSAEGKYDEAVPALRAAVKLQDDNWDAQFGLAAVYAGLGRQREATEQYRVLLKLQPGHPLVSTNLAWILATSEEPGLRNPPEAIRLARAACEAAQNRSPSALDALAAAYAADGQFAEAAASVRQAISLLVEAGQKDAAAQLQQRLRTYEQHLPPDAGRTGPAAAHGPGS